MKHLKAESTMMWSDAKMSLAALRKYWRDHCTTGTLLVVVPSALVGEVRKLPCFTAQEDFGPTWTPDNPKVFGALEVFQFQEVE